MASVTCTFLCVILTWPAINVFCSYLSTALKLCWGVHGIDGGKCLRWVTNAKFACVPVNCLSHSGLLHYHQGIKVKTTIMTALKPELFYKSLDFTLIPRFLVGLCHCSFYVVQKWRANSFNTNFLPLVTCGWLKSLCMQSRKNIFV